MSGFLALVFVLLTCAIYSMYKSTKRPKNFPPGPFFLPWLGNVLQLRQEALRSGGQHIVFEKWAHKYKSKIIGLKLGDEMVVVALSYPFVKQIHLRDVFEGRPDNFFIRLRTMGKRMGITFTDGKLWYENRIFAVKKMKSIGYGKTQMDFHIEAESNTLLTQLSKSEGCPVWPGSLLASSVINVLWCLIAGKPFGSNDERLYKLLQLLNKRSKIFDMCGGTLSQFPWLRFIAPDISGYNILRQLNKELHLFFMETISQHKLELSKENEESDFIFAYMKEIQNLTDLKNDVFNETQLTMTILDFFIAGSQTTSNTLDLAFMIIALNPLIQENLNNEIIFNQGNKEFPHLKHKSSFPYFDAFIMETQRFFHITPVTGPRRALCDTFLNGYKIPKNTTVLIGLRSVLMDTNYWTNPECFRPERFLNKDGKILKNECFIPFGQGKRRCLGDTLAKACIFSFLVTTLQHFKLSLCTEDRPEITLTPGISLSPKPYKIKFTKIN